MDTIKSTLAQNFGGAAHVMAGSAQQFSIENDVPDLSDKVALITGGSEGIGYATAYTLLKHNAARVFIISQREEVQSQAEESVRKHLGDTFADRLTFFQCDLSDLPSVAQIAKQVSSQTDRLDILCLNAGRGIMTYQTTDYIIDRHMAVNHLGHVTLTSHLLPLLKKTAAASANNKVRIQIQSSNAHQGSPKTTKFATIDELQQDLGPNGQYGRSKLANLLYARYLAAHLTTSHPNILANATHPGVVETKMSTQDIHEPYPKLGYAMDVGLKPFKKDIWEGCVSTVYAATAIEESGKYVCPPVAFEEGSELANDAELGEQLMRITREIVKEKFGSESVERECPLRDY